MKKLHIPAIPAGPWQIKLTITDHEPVSMTFPNSDMAFDAYRRLKISGTYLGHPITGASLTPEPFKTEELL
jgi:hypothetical protein